MVAWMWHNALMWLYYVRESSSSLLEPEHATAHDSMLLERNTREHELRDGEGGRSMHDLVRGMDDERVLVVQGEQVFAHILTVEPDGRRHHCRRQQRRHLVGIPVEHRWHQVLPPTHTTGTTLAVSAHAHYRAPKPACRRKHGASPS